MRPPVGGAFDGVGTLNSFVGRVELVGPVGRFGFRGAFLDGVLGVFSVWLLFGTELAGWYHRVSLQVVVNWRYP